ncbi:MAG: hypothetical protein HQM12_00950 [SAR324 cluster bacterium]|nr:hypothetical protein [SAR324 cluster bacterium]
MKRIQAFEFNERGECPKIIRESIVEILGNGIRWGKLYDAAGVAFADFCRDSGTTQVLDLCSGSGQPVSVLIEVMERQGLKAPEFLLSDLHPNVSAMESVAQRHQGNIKVIHESLDATNVPHVYDGMARTIISAFHHFPPHLALSILKDCVEKRQAIFVLEAFPRNFRTALSIVPALSFAFLAYPFISRQERIKKLLNMPMVAMFGIWDIIISILRIHSEDELMAMGVSLGANYRWSYQQVPYPPYGAAVIFSGIPQ